MAEEIDDASEGRLYDVPSIADRRTGYFWAKDELFERSISSKAKLVYLSMCRRADRSKTCWPAYPQMASDTGYSEASIRRAIKELSEAKLIRVKRRKRPDGSYMSNQYILIDFEHTPLQSDTTLASHRQEGTVPQGADKEYPVKKEYPLKEKVKLSRNPEIAEMQKHLGFPDRTDKDPIPNPGKEGKFIKQMKNRGWNWPQILLLWKEKCQRKGEFVSMQWVNEDIGKERGDGARRRSYQEATAEELAASVGKPIREEHTAEELRASVGKPLKG